MGVAFKTAALDVREQWSDAPIPVKRISEEKDWLFSAKLSVKSEGKVEACAHSLKDLISYVLFFFSLQETWRMYFTKMKEYTKQEDRWDAGSKVRRQEMRDPSEW